MNTMMAPSVICNARVIEYASTSEAVFTGALQRYVDGVRLGVVPVLVICEDFKGEELFLFHCDENWDVLGTAGWKKSEGGSVEKIKASAEKYYAGISSQWIGHDASLEDARAYQADLVGDERCSFCGRSMYEVNSLLAGNDGARICDLCVKSFHRQTSADKPRC
jgi:hypothetical protein